MLGITNNKSIIIFAVNRVGDKKKAVITDNCWNLLDFFFFYHKGMNALPEISATVLSGFRLISAILFRINIRRTMRKQKDSHTPSRQIPQNFAESRKYKINSVRWAVLAKIES